MAITLITYNGMNVTPKSDAIADDASIQSGVFSGCEVTYLGSNILHVAAGYGIVKGRRFEVEAEDFTVAMPSSGTINGRIYVHMDLGAETPVEILTKTAASLPALVQDENCNYTNGIYEIELATFTASATAISSLTEKVRRIDSAGSSAAVRRITLPAVSWSSGTTTIDGRAYYTQIAQVSKIYSESPILSIGAAGTLPTATEEANYAKINAAIADVDNARITFYATSKPTGQVIIIAKEVE